LPDTVYDRNAPSVKRVVAELEKPEVRMGLTRLSLRITGSPADADDLAADALERVIDPDDSPWEKRTFLSHMKLAMRHIWDQQRRAVRFEREIPDEDVTRGKKGVGREPPADEELARRRQLAIFRQLAESVLGEIGDKHPLVRQCFALGCKGTDEPAEQARILGVTVDEVNQAHETLKYHARRVRAQWDLAEEKRMRELRAKARPFLREVES
jgi:DNA-directed RNA polymerase specialized sigma24 family protein